MEREEPNAADEIEDDHRNWQSVLDLLAIDAGEPTAVETEIREGLAVLADRSGFPIAYLSHIDDQVHEFLVVEDRTDTDTVPEGRTDPLSETYCRHTVSGDLETTVLEVGENLSREDPAYRNFGFETYAGTPVRVDGNVYGTLCLVSPDSLGDRLTDSVLSFLEVVATWLGRKIERRERERQTAVLQRVVRHNLRNSLTVIQGHADSLPDEPASATQKEAIRSEVRSLRTLSHEAKQLESLFQGQTTLETVDIARSVRDAVRDARSARSDATIEVMGPNTLEARAIPAFRYAVEELIENAVVHAEQAQPTVTVRIEERDAQVTVSVADTGPGIPSQEARTLQGTTEIGQLTHGSGLGLWLVRRIVQQSNGRLAIEENDPRGSVVRITLSKAAGDGGDVP